jgi:uncharacterized protein YjbJ (UPF0337 family)
MPVPDERRPRKETTMGDVFEGRWKQLKGDAKRVWVKLTDDDWDRAEGNREKLVGSLQERYGWEKVRAESEFDRFVESTRTPAGAGVGTGRSDDSF